MEFRYKEECHTIASQSETKIQELKQKIENQRTRNEQLQSEIGDVKRKEAEVCREIIETILLDQFSCFRWIEFLLKMSIE